MFIDAALADAARHALSWSPPAIVLPLGAAAAYGREIETILDELDSRQAVWLQEGERIRAKLRETLSSTGRTAEVCGSLAMFIELVEQRAVQTSRDSYPLLARMKRNLREVAELRSDQREFAELVIARVEEAVARQLEERTDFALFLRALLSEHDPQAREGTTFDSPEELQRHLSGVLDS